MSEKETTTKPQRELLSEVAASRHGEMHFTGRYRQMADRLWRRGLLSGGLFGWYRITVAGLSLLARLEEEAAPTTSRGALNE